MKIFGLKPVLSASLVLWIAGCATAPRPSSVKPTVKSESEWLKHYCSTGPRELGGDLVIRANTREFKGQYPASLHFEKDGKFILEATNIIGGTIVRLTGNGKTIDLLAPPKPQYNRSGVTHYLGLEIPVISQLLLGDLPCPDKSENWNWKFEKAQNSVSEEPTKVVLVPKGIYDSKLKIELLIEEWDLERHYAKKVTVKGPEGELKWTWRSRN